MSGFFTNPSYALTGGTVGAASNATFRGPWVRIEDAHSVGIQVNLIATGSPAAVWAVELTDDFDAPNKADANLVPGVATMTNTAEMTAAAPNGTTTDRKVVFTLDPCPRAKWLRFVYVFTSGGSASQLLQVGISTFSDRA